MGTPSPRHLARPQGRSGPSRRQLLTAGVALTAILVAAALGVVALTRGPGPARHAGPRPRPQAGLAPAPTRAPGTAPASTFPPVVAMPGNLLDNGDLEGGLSGWSPLGGATPTRRSPGHSGHWAVAFSLTSSATAPAAGPGPGVTFADVTASRAGRTYQATVWVRADRPGTAVTFALREVQIQGQSGAPTSADVVGLTLPAGGAWLQLAVVHQARMPSARLVLELTATRLPAGGHVTADQFDVESSQN